MNKILNSKKQEQEPEDKPEGMEEDKEPGISRRVRRRTVRKKAAGRITRRRRTPRRRNVIKMRERVNERDGKVNENTEGSSVIPPSKNKRERIVRPNIV